MVPAELYYPIFVVLMCMLTTAISLKIASYSNMHLLKGRNSSSIIRVFCFLFIIIIGLRPADALCFGDSESYCDNYLSMQAHSFSIIETGHDVLFYQFMMLCSKYVSVNVFFLLIEIGYVVPLIIASKKMFKNNADLAMMFCLGAFSFFSYGTNGLRHGLAASLIILFFSLWNGRLIEKILGLVIAFIAYNIHGSIILPFVAFIIAVYYPKTKTYILFWFLSIILSLLFSGFFSSLFSTIDFADDRLASYLGRTDRYRYDFLLYSVVPIAFGYIVIIRKKIKDSVYSNILNTYIICNAFWIMIINAEFSNRFAYLSWFLYPFLLAYPLLRISVWKGQARIASYTYIGQSLFTLFMMIRDAMR